MQLSNLTKEDIKTIKKAKKKKNFSFLTAKRIDADYKTGLTQSQVKQRVMDGYVNYSETHTTKVTETYFSQTFLHFLIC